MPAIPDRSVGTSYDCPRPRAMIAAPDIRQLAFDKEHVTFDNEHRTSTRPMEHWIEPD